MRVLAPSRGIVSFRCESGAAVGQWMGSDPPAAGTFDVEIEVPEEAAEWAAVSSGATSMSRVVGNYPAALITGEVVRFGDGEDPVVEVRVGPDVLLVEITNQRSGLPLGGFISFQVSNIQLYPYDL